jgi:antirestriction protein ArdC
VFNTEQVAGLPASLSDEVRAPVEPVEAAEAILKGMPLRPAVQHDGGDRAFYRPLNDTVHLPARTSFPLLDEYYSTLFHELGHSTGHASRLNRETLTRIAAVGDHAYSNEELIAEMTAAFLCGEAGISPSVIENQGAYLRGWLGRLRNDRRLVVSAATQAQRAADFILNRATGETLDAEASQGPEQVAPHR